MAMQHLWDFEGIVMRVLSVGEVLWDVFPQRELMGGAPLNFAVNSTKLGNSAALVSAVGIDARGARIREEVTASGIDSRYIEVLPEQPTGVALVGKTPEGEPSFSIPRPAAFDFIKLSPEAIRDVREILKPDWLYYGTLVQTNPGVEDTTRLIYESVPEMRCFYDMNLRPGCWNLSLVQRLSAMASVVKLNELEARTLGEITGMGSESFSLGGFCKDWAENFKVHTICVTLGAGGCMIFQDGVTQTVPGFPAAVEDTVGAGDAFAAAFLHGYHRGWPILTTARFANAVGSVVASRAGATPEWNLDECLRLAEIERIQC